MKTLKRLFMAFMLITMTVAVSFGWLKAQVKLSGISVALAGNEELLISKSSSGTYGKEIAVDEGEVKISCATSTDGKTFYNEKGGNCSTYYQQKVYIKASTNRTVNAKVECDNPDDALRVAVESPTTCVVFTPDEFSELKALGTQGAAAKDYYIRIWYDGETATEETSSVVSVVFE